jgi:hypothetical protein
MFDKGESFPPDATHQLNWLGSIVQPIRLIELDAHAQVLLRNPTESNATYRLRRIGNAELAKRAVVCTPWLTNWYLQPGFTEKTDLDKPQCM